MTLPTTTRVFKILGWALLAFLIYSLVKKRIKRLIPKPKSTFPKIIPLNELSSKDRSFFEELRDTVYESDRWEELLPELDLNPNWKIQPIPPVESEVLRFNVWNKPHIYPATVAFDPYLDEEKTVWSVFGEGTEIIDVPVDDTKQLRAVIASVLQDISPVKP